jgi:hypothetical protein
MSQEKFVHFDSLADRVLYELREENERLRERIKDAEKTMEPEWGSRSVQDYYKKYPDPVDANIGPCDH